MDGPSYTVRPYVLLTEDLSGVQGFIKSSCWDDAKQKIELVLEQKINPRRVVNKSHWDKQKEN